MLLYTEMLTEKAYFVNIEAGFGKFNVASILQDLYHPSAATEVPGIGNCCIYFRAPHLFLFILSLIIRFIMYVIMNKLGL